MRARPALLLLASALFAASSTYEEFVTGNPADVRATTQPGFALVGGGKDQDDVYRWMISKAGGGDFVVVRASGADGYNQYLNDLGKLNSVRTLVLKTPQAAQDAAAETTIRQAEALFIAGGDQWNYVRLWREARVGVALQSLLDRGVPFGGTSAGLAVLGQYAFTAEHDSVTSAEALMNPYHERVTIGKDFLRIPLLRRTITDSHFHARDRMGRTLAFLARILKDHQEASTRAIAIDERTALLVEQNGQAVVAGEGSVYLLQATGQPAVCERGQPLSLEHVAVVRLQRGGRFDLPRWRAPGGAHYELQVRRGVITTTQPGGAIY